MLGILEGRASRRMRVSELAERLEVHPRTVKRYIDALADVLVDEEGRPRVRRELIEGRAYASFQRPDAGLRANVFQYAAVHAAAQHFSAIADPVLGESAGMVLEQLADGLGVAGDVAQQVRDTFIYVPFGPKDYGENEDTLDALVRTALRRVPVRFNYTAGSGNERLAAVHPYAIVMHRDALYLLGGEVHDAGRSTRLYAVDRIHDVELVRGEHFELPPNFCARSWFDGRLGLWGGPEVSRVRMAFDASVVPYVKERRWPGFVAWTELEDGRSVLEMKVPITPQVSTWVLSWGRHAEVLEPRHLREQVADNLRDALARYR